jgi:hypothetical protein
VDADYVFPDPTNPWAEQFPEIVNINNLEEYAQADFMAIKIGDVNLSSRANGLQTLAPRSVQDVFELKAEELEMKRGNEYTISFRGDMSTVEGYQFTMELDPTKVVLLDILDGMAKAENFGVFQEEGIITSSFNRNQATQVTGDDVLFSITLRATADAELSEVIGISSRYTAAEAYSISYDDLAVGLAIGTETIGDEYALYQNRPNPFSAETVISFKLPEAMEAKVEFKDVQGRTVRLLEGDFHKGYNEIRLKANELPASGVFYYTLHAGDFVASKKMILLGE